MSSTFFPSITPPRSRHSVYNGAARLLFPLHSCERVGLQREESLFLIAFRASQSVTQGFSWRMYSIMRKGLQRQAISGSAFTSETSAQFGPIFDRDTLIPGG